jgi:hypothetical protein
MSIILSWAMHPVHALRAAHGKLMELGSVSGNTVFVVPFGRVRRVTVTGS